MSGVKYRDLLTDAQKVLALPRPLTLMQFRREWTEMRDGDWTGEGDVLRVEVSELVERRKEVWNHIYSCNVVVLVQQGDVVCHLVPWPLVWKERASEGVNASGLEGVIWRAVVAYRQAVLRHFLYGTEE